MYGSLCNAIWRNKTNKKIKELECQNNLLIMITKFTDDDNKNIRFDYMESSSAVIVFIKSNKSVKTEYNKLKQWNMSNT